MTTSDTPSGDDRITIQPGRAVPSTPGSVRLEFPLQIGNEGTHTLWFEVPDWAAGDPAIADGAALAVLLPAMRTGRDIVVHGRLSPTLLSNLLELMSAVAMWFPEFSPIAIHAQQIDDGNGDRAERSVGLFFSGGVDSFYSLRSTPLRVEHLVHVDGLDSTSRDPGLHAQIAAMLDDVSHRTSLGLIRVRTNVRGLLDGFAQWNLHAHGIALGAVGHALAGGLGTTIVAADQTYADLRPYGVHPATTHLYGSHRLTMSSHGWGTTRLDKVVAIADWDVAMDHLRVCWENPDGAYNCGVCEKCIRTIVDLELAGATERCVTLGSLPDLETIATMEQTAATLDYAEPALLRAQESEDHQALAEALTRLVGTAKALHALERLERDWPSAATGDVSDFVRAHRETLYRSLSAYEGRWLVRRVIGSLPGRVASKLRRRRASD